MKISLDQYQHHQCTPALGWKLDQKTKVYSIRMKIGPKPQCIILGWKYGPKDQSVQY